MGINISDIKESKKFKAVENYCGNNIYMFNGESTKTYKGIIYWDLENL